MSCEGLVDWNSPPPQVVHFLHRKDKPSHTLSFRDANGPAYRVELRAVR